MCLPVPCEIFFSMNPQQLESTLFPYTTLFRSRAVPRTCRPAPPCSSTGPARTARCRTRRSEEHTSELQSRGHLVCRLLLEKKNDELSLRLVYPSSEGAGVSWARVGTGVAILHA